MKRNALLIGGFVVGAFLIIIASILWLGGSDLFSRQQKARIYYEGNVSGLSIGAPVTFRGVSIGQVTDIGILMDGTLSRTTIPISLKLQLSSLQIGDGDTGKALNVKTLVQRGLRAKLASQSVVTGQKAIELDFIPNTPAKLRGGGGTPEIPAMGDKFGALIDQVADLPLRDTVAEVRAAVQDLRKTLGGTQLVLDGATRELQLTAVESRKTLAAATEAIRQVQSSSTITLNSITSLADATRQTVVQAQPELQRTLIGARAASESAKLAMDRVADLAAPGAPLRSDLEGAVKDLSQAARGLRSWSELLEEKPNAIIFGEKRE